jgi:hypothetical protein
MNPNKYIIHLVPNNNIYFFNHNDLYKNYMKKGSIFNSGNYCPIVLTFIAIIMITILFVIYYPSESENFFPLSSSNLFEGMTTIANNVWYSKDFVPPEGWENNEDCTCVCNNSYQNNPKCICPCKKFKRNPTQNNPGRFKTNDIGFSEINAKFSDPPRHPYKSQHLLSHNEPYPTNDIAKIDYIGDTDKNIILPYEPRNWDSVYRRDSTESKAYGYSNPFNMCNYPNTVLCNDKNDKRNKCFCLPNNTSSSTGETSKDCFCITQEKVYGTSSSTPQYSTKTISSSQPIDIMKPSYTVQSQLYDYQSPKSPSSELQSSGPRTSESQLSRLISSESQSSGSQSSESQSSGSQSSESQSSESQSSESQSYESQSSESQLSRLRSSGFQSSESQLSRLQTKKINGTSDNGKWYTEDIIPPNGWINNEKCKCVCYNVDNDFPKCICPCKKFKPGPNTKYPANRKQFEVTTTKFSKKQQKADNDIVGVRFIAPDPDNKLLEYLPSSKTKDIVYERDSVVKKKQMSETLCKSNRLYCPQNCNNNKCFCLRTNQKVNDEYTKNCYCISLDPNESQPISVEDNISFEDDISIDETIVTESDESTDDILSYSVDTIGTEEMPTSIPEKDSSGCSCFLSTKKDNDGSIILKSMPSSKITHQVKKPIITKTTSESHPKSIPKKIPEFIKPYSEESLHDNTSSEETRSEYASESESEEDCSNDDDVSRFMKMGKNVNVFYNDCNSCNGGNI